MKVLKLITKAVWHFDKSIKQTLKIVLLPQEELLFTDNNKRKNLSYLLHRSQGLKCGVYYFKSKRKQKVL